MQGWSIRWDSGHGNTILLPRRSKEYSANLRLSGMVVQPIGYDDRAFPFPLWISQQRLEALAIQAFLLRLTPNTEEHGVGRARLVNKPPIEVDRYFRIIGSGIGSILA